MLQYFQNNSKYSKIIFRILKERKNYGHRSFLEEDLREKLSIPESHKQADINRRVIERSFVDLMLCFRDFSYEITNSRSSRPTTYIFTWYPEKRRQRDSNTDPNIPKLIACPNILTNKIATEDDKFTAMDRYFRLTRGKYKEMQKENHFVFLKLIYGNTFDNSVIQDAKRTDLSVLEFLIGQYRKLQETDKLTAEGLTTLMLLEAEASKRRKDDEKFNDFLDLDGIPQNIEFNPVWEGNPADTVLSASKRLKPLEMYDKAILNLILQRYFKALTKKPDDTKLLQDIGVVTAYLQKLH